MSKQKVDVAVSRCFCYGLSAWVSTVERQSGGIMLEEIAEARSKEIGLYGFYTDFR